MKQNISLKGLLFAALMLLGAVSVSAQSKLSIEPVKFVGHDVTKLQVNFEKANPVGGMNFTVVLPDFLEFVGSAVERNEERFTSQSTISFNPSTGVVLVASWQENVEIQGENGALLYFPVKVKDDVKAEVSGEIVVENINFTNWNGTQSWKQDAFDVAVNYNPYVVEFTPAADPVVLNAAGTADFGVNIKSDCQVIGFQAVLDVPAGYTVAEQAVLSGRCPNDANMTISNRSGKYRLVYYNLSNSALTGNEGLVFTLKVTATDEAAEQNATLKMDDIIVSYAPGKSVDGIPFSATLINSAPAYNRLKAAVDALKTNLAAAKAEIEQSCPDVKDQFTGDDIATAIDDLEGEINGTYATGDIIAAEEGYNTQIAAVQAQIDALKADAAKAQADVDEANRVAANAAAYKAVQDELETLFTALETAENEVKEKYPDTDVTAEVAAAQHALEEATLAAEQAYIAVKDAGTFNYTFDKAPIEALIAAVTASAKTQFDEAERQSNNAKAYQAAQDELEALMEALEAAKTDAAEKYPDADVEEEVAAAQAAIEAASVAAENAYTAVQTEGTFNYTVDKDAIQALIDNIGVVAAKEQAEIDRQSNNAKAYKAVQDELEALMEALEAAKADAAEKYPDADVAEEIAAAQAAVETASVAAENAYAAVQTEGTFNYTLDKAAIEALIAAITDDAKAKQAEIDRQNNNAKAYKAVQDELEALMQSLEAAEKTVAENYPDVDVTASVAAAQTAIEQATVAAENAYAAVQTAGEFNYTVDKEAIETLIAAVLTDAKTQAEENEEQRVAANSAAYKAVQDQLEALFAALEAAENEAKEKYPDADVTATVAAAQHALEEATLAAEQAYIAVKDAGTFDYTLDKAPIEALIADVLVDAEKQQAEIDRNAANSAAYKAVQDELEALFAALEAAENEAKEKYPDADVTADVAAAQHALEEVTLAAEQAYVDVKDAGTFEFTFDKAPIEALIAAVLEDAQKQQAEFDRNAANSAAYKAVQDELEALFTALEAAENEAKEKYPDADVTATVAAAQHALEEATLAAEQAYVDVKDAGTFDYTLDKAPIEALIAAVLEDAKTQQAEADRKAANDKAYQNSLDQIAALREALQAAKDKVAAEHPEVDVTVQVNIAEAAINQADAKAAAENRKVAEEGTYSYEVPVAEIEALIQDILDYAEQNGIESVYVEGIDKDTKIFNLSGVRLARPQQGKINILVGADGSVRKVFVR